MLNGCFFVPNLHGQSLLYYSMSRNLKLLSLNVRSMRNFSKWSANFSYLKWKRTMIFRLQKSHSPIENEKVWSAEWLIKYFLAWFLALEGGLHFSKYVFYILFAMRGGGLRKELFNCWRCNGWRIDVIDRLTNEFN